MTSSLRSGFGIRLLATLGMACNASHAAAFDVVTPPACINNNGEAVQFVEREGGRAGVTAGMAARRADGVPVVVRSNYEASPQEFQAFMDRHECAHHQTGDVDRPHPPRNGPEHLMNESISDCVAILRLRDEEGYNDAAVGKITAWLRKDMTQIGFPEISISSRISNITNCFSRDGGADDLVTSVLKQRGLR